MAISPGNHTLKTFRSKGDRHFIGIILVSLLVSLVPFSVAQAQPETSYIIVHALNPEGIEIASIEGMNRYCVQIYDGDTLIGYGAHDEETCNKAIEISPGTHTIKAEFNGMIKEENITLEPGEAKTIFFVFDRTEFDLAGWIDNLNADYSRSISRTFDLSAGEDVGDCDPYAENTEDIFFVEACGQASVYHEFRDAYAVGNYHASSWVSLTSTTFLAGASYSFDVEGLGCVEVSARVGPWWGRHFGRPAGIPAYDTFDYWFTQFIMEGVYPSIFDPDSEKSLIWGLEGIITHLMPAGRGYPELVVVFPGEEIYIGGGFLDSSGSGSDSMTRSATLRELKMSSVPYDIGGTGIRCEGQPHRLIINQPKTDKDMYLLARVS